MVRRFFVSAFSSAAALALSDLYPSGAAKGQSAPGSRMSFPEPDPIVVDEATSDRARALLDAVTHGTFDRSQLMPQLYAHVGPDFFARAAASASALGVAQSMFSFEQRITSDQTWTFFRVRYPKEILTWVVGVDAESQITRLDLRRSPSYHIFNVTWRNIEY